MYFLYGFWKFTLLKSFFLDIVVSNPDEKSIMTYIAQFLQYSNDLPLADDDFEVRPNEYPSLMCAFADLPLFFIYFVSFSKHLAFIMFLQLRFLFLSVTPSWLDAASNSALSHMPLSCEPPYILHPCCAGLPTAPGTGVMERLWISSQYHSWVSFYLFQHVFWLDN